MSTARRPRSRRQPWRDGALLVWLLTFAAASSGNDDSRIVRIGIATDLESYRLECCGEATLVVSEAGRRYRQEEDVTILPSASQRGEVSYRLQVAALKDEKQAITLAERLTELSSQPAEAVFDAATDLYRVRVGRFQLRPAAEELARRLERLGVGGAWVVQEGSALEDPKFRVVASDGERTIPGRLLTVRTQAETLSILGVEYRGELLLYINERGRLNVINEVPLESYLRGVVPKELGPAQYPELEALKAQAVAARSYTLSQLKTFSSEGYDLCATPRCQVYGGASAEHPLSDRAIEETRGVYLMAEGEPAEALYTATCGGHTEDVDVIFPNKSASFLEGTPCLEGSPHLMRTTARRPLSSYGLPSACTSEERDDVTRSLEACLDEIAADVGLPARRSRLTGLLGSEVREHITRLFDLKLDGRLLGTAADLRQLVQSPPADLAAAELELATELSRPRIDEWTVLARAVAGSVGWVERLEGTFATATNDTLHLRVGEERIALARSESVGLFRLEGEVVASLRLHPGDRVAAFVRAGHLMALAHVGPFDEVRLGHLPRRDAWRRHRSRSWLRNQVRSLYPGFELESLETGPRGVSGRVARLWLIDRQGARLGVEGLAIRWLLDVPDNWFQMTASADGYTFVGRGWGHGVGMCQVGSFGMAQRGHDYASILRHYYGRATLTSTVHGAVHATGSQGSQ